MTDVGSTQSGLKVTMNSGHGDHGCCRWLYARTPVAAMALLALSSCTEPGRMEYMDYEDEILEK